MRKHPGWVKFPATFVPRAPVAVRTIPGTNRPWPLDKRRQPWPRSRFGQPLRPLDEYPPGVRAPGEGYNGPIADPDEAMRACLAFKDMLAQAAKYAADPDAPIKAYRSARGVWENPAKYANPSRPETAPVPLLAPVHGWQARTGATPGLQMAVAAPAPGIDPAERPDLAVIRAQYQTADDRMVEYKPHVGPVSVPGRGSVSLTETEVKMLEKLNPRQLYLLNEVRRKAFTASEVYIPMPDDVSYPPGVTTEDQKQEWLDNDGHRDAFRHTFWNAVMARDFGRDWASQFATAHEGVPGNSGSREAMDLYNNSIGRRIAAEHPGASDEELARFVDEALRKGELIVLDGSGDLQWSDRVQRWRHGLTNRVADGGGRPVPGGDARARSP